MVRVLAPRRIGRVVHKRRGSQNTQQGRESDMPWCVIFPVQQVDLAQQAAGRRDRMLRMLAQSRSKIAWASAKFRRMDAASADGEPGPAAAGHDQRVAVYDRSAARADRAQIDSKNRCSDYHLRVDGVYGVRLADQGNIANPDAGSVQNVIVTQSSIRSLSPHAPARRSRSSAFALKAGKPAVRLRAMACRSSREPPHRRPGAGHATVIATIRSAAGSEPDHTLWPNGFQPTVKTVERRAWSFPPRSFQRPERHLCLRDEPREDSAARSR